MAIAWGDLSWFMLILWLFLLIISLAKSERNDLLSFTSILGLIFGVLFLRESAIYGLFILMFNMYLFYRSLIES